MISEMGPKQTVLNTILLALLALPILLYELFGTPTQRGFFADDDSLAYPYKESTIPDWLLYIVGFGAPITLIFLHQLYEIKSTFTRTNILKCLQHSMSATIIYLLGIHPAKKRYTTYPLYEAKLSFFEIESHL